MYNCVVKVKLIGCDFEFEDLLNAEQLPEDCKVELLSDEDAESPDVLYVYGGISDFNDKTQNCGGVSAVITDGNDIPDGNAELWVIPDGCSNRGKLLERYFLSAVCKIKEAFDHRIMKICLDTAADSVPDLIWFKDVIGAHLMTNESFCKAVEKTKEQIYKRGHYYIWDIPKEEYDQGDYVCLESEEVVMKEGKTCLFDEKVKTKSGMRQFKTYKSPLYDVDGRLFGTCGVARDVTDLHKINSELEVVLESVPFGIMIEDTEETLVSANRPLEKFFPDVAAYEGKNCAEWKAATIDNVEINELTVDCDGKQHILKFAKEPINDIFGERIGMVTVFRDVTSEHELQKQTAEHANTDFLTGLNNRRSLFAYLEKARKQPYMSMITVDLDNFKKVNDTCGHKMGDNVLVETAGMLNECFSNDFVARLGGDEFLVVITREADREQLEAETQHFIDSFNANFAGNSDLAVMTVSAGLSVGVSGKDSAHNAEALMYSSDSALYEAKKSGKSRYSVYEGVNE
ncbi:MAG: diguanylate cyclase [Oscillospiraceae bacterium]|nr:diguanylate cyclase [Oscillospiraceae bacterium]